MTILSLQIGDIVTARFPQQNPQAHEQEGQRPAIVVGLPNRVGNPRFPLVILVPITSDRGQAWANDSPDLYPKFPAGTAGLRQPSIALLDQIRVLDFTRITEYWGRLTPEEYDPILRGLKRMIDP
ncbi:MULTISPECIES: type II toxin-antitoxin system PemK/MazF family toxin [Planktothricoides]|uniref:Type II toxin-antitoxin system PemK/MazF family toxin n=2 Tax=Planktothricoides raciborskii TaxID=132608 RepID=A0AAU8JCL3_9CYAN|nr:MULTISPECIES: type II toxin-antitoxin system PemK/MazF family toxin [Planktothricoides]MBD2545766.1 type II toxin-antitoxin system PemK/MazF family toxin [Planktothricoides raciborskii FACHB-1370]MBD2584013.1 type II toxin-antitoxin system PemK/MazF family toxin [Planktothricoides raciborskii FACHB-1261]